MADKPPPTTTPDGPRKPRPPAQLPVTAPPDFALPEKRGGWLRGKGS